MTIKHTRKDIASEPGDIVLNLTKNTPALKNNNQNENYNNDLIITLRRQDQYNEVLFEDLEENSNINAGQDLEPYNDQQTINIPLSELVRLKYLQANYYTKTDIDDRIKIYIHVVSSINDLPAQGQSNYIYLVPFTSEDDDTNDSSHPNAYKEYVWTDENKYELVGSTKVNLSGMLRKTELNAELLNATNFTNLQTSVGTNTSNITSLTNSFDTHSHGNITRDGKLNAASKILVSNSSKNIVGVTKIEDSQVNVATVYNSIGNSNNDDLGTVLGSVNTTISNINTTLATLPNYLLKSEIYDEIWGTNANGFRSMQTAEASGSASKNYKLGDYIYDKVYTKNDIDTLIGTLAQLQQQTLEIL